MTEQELEKLKESIQTITEMATKGVKDLSEFSLKGAFLSDDSLRKELEIIEKISKEELEKLKKEQDKYNKMESRFLHQVERELHYSIVLEGEQQIDIDNQKNYYVVSSPNIIKKYPRDKTFGSYACIFDKDGNLLFHTNLGGKIECIENHVFLQYFRLNHRYSRCEHIQLVDGCWKIENVFLGVQSIRKCSDKFLEMKYESAPEFFNKEDNEVYNKLYNIETGKVILQNFDGCKNEYPEFENLEPNQYLLITKKIKISNSDNMARLQFFIDLDGKVVSNVFDLERGIEYLLDQNKEQQETLQDIYQLVLQSLETETKKTANIYQLKLKKKND